MVFCVVADPTTSLQATWVVDDTELVTLQRRSEEMERPLIGPKLMVPDVAEAASQVPPTILVFPTRSW